MKETGNTTALGVLLVGPLITARASEHGGAEPAWRPARAVLYLQGLGGFAWNSCMDGHTYLGLRGMLGPMTMGPKFSGSISIHSIFPNNCGLVNTSRNVI